MHLKLSHINVTMPKGCEDLARAFYTPELWFGLARMLAKK